MNTIREYLNSKNRTLVIAHRGDSKNAPENTLPSFEAALELGADFIELDYLHSADGIPMVFHDETLDRTTNACQILGGKEISFAETTSETLAKLDAGLWFNEKYRGAEVATLERALRLIQSRAMTMIERKSGDAKTIIDLLLRMGEIERVALMAFDWEFLAECRALSPVITLGALGTGPIDEAAIQRATPFRPSMFGWLHEDVADGDPARLKEHGIDLWTWTVDDPLRAVHLSKIGVKGIISNRPGTMLKIFRDGISPEPL